MSQKLTPEEKAFNAAQCSICLLDWPMAQCLACKFHQPEIEVEFNPQTMEMYNMSNQTVTVQEMDRVANSIGLKMYNDQAMKKVCLMVRLGFDATQEMYQREERNTNEAEQRKQAAEVANDDKWLGMFETLPAMVDPRTDEQIALDIFQSETESTRNTDYPV